jgi:hypothetical protein
MLLKPIKTERKYIEKLELSRKLQVIVVFVVSAPPYLLFLIVLEEICATVFTVT